MKRTVSIALLVLVAAALAVAATGCGSEEIVAPKTSIDLAKDVAAKAGIMAIETGIKAAIAANGVAPTTADAATLGSVVSPWPNNPWTMEPMKSGTEIGDYTYRNLGGVSYSLIAHLSGGEYTRP
jgi:hypothetical protein